MSAISCSFVIGSAEKFTVQETLAMMDYSKLGLCRVVVHVLLQSRVMQPKKGIFMIVYLHD
jgi:hypothetical protein